MTIFWSIIIGCLYSISFYLFLRRNIFKVLVAVMISSYATNLLIFFSASPVEGGIAIIKGNREVIDYAVSDPLAQALILTAIVIGFGVTAFCIILFNKIYSIDKNDDLHEIRNLE